MIAPSVRISYFLLLLCLSWAIVVSAADQSNFAMPKTGLEPRELAIVVNENDPVSVNIGNYYREIRQIPETNLIRLKIPVGTAVLSREQFEPVKRELDRITPAHIQAYALAWTKPYRVDCMSITAAMGMGFDQAYCSTQCGPTKPSGYFNSSSVAPFSDHKIRPAMLLAGGNFDDVKRLIGRGVASDSTFPAGTGYLLTTSDKNRSVRSALFDATVQAVGDAFRLERLSADSIKNKKDVLFYFTGLIKVPNLQTLGFVPGAIADHLTSTGGALTESQQMSSLRWLEAGATGSYGTVVEPCNHLAKFPHPGVVMERYAEGNTLIEAYWKSVAWPGEGVFIGEPLAKPFSPRIIDAVAGTRSVKLFTPRWRNLRLERAESAIGPYRQVDIFPVKPGLNQLKIGLPDATGYYRLAE
jgi:uncharacterized protein (TIGR03790 family)